MYLEGSEIPYNLTVQSIIDELVEILELPNKDESGHKVEFYLKSRLQNRILDIQATVEENHIKNSDLLQLLIK